MTKAQKETFKQLKESGKACNVAQAIRNRLMLSPCSINVLKNELDIARSSVVGRISELCDQGLVKVDRKFINEHGNWNSLYKLTYEGERQRLKEKRKFEKINRYKKYLESQGYKVSKINF